MDACDKIWFTCCTLHNWLLKIDGYNYLWDGELGLFEENKVEENVSSAVLRHLHTPAARHAYNTSGMGRGKDVDQNKNDDADNDDNDDDGSRSAVAPFQADQVCNCHKIPLPLFHNHLIEHFDILFQQNKLVWPRCTIHNSNDMH